MLSDLERLIDEQESVIDSSDFKYIMREIRRVGSKIDDLEYDLKEKSGEIDTLEFKLDEARDQIGSLQQGGQYLSDILKEEWWKEAKEKYTLEQLESVFGVKGNLKSFNLI